jgi:L-lactate dehydrogenase complex protein LldG
MFPASKLLDSLGVAAALEQGGFDCGLTDAAYAVAETGSVVIRPGPGHGRAISLVPVHHVVILEPANFLPDLLDLFERLETDGLPGSGCVLITGPSKTADIEANLVEGVHGPRVVKAFVLR